MASPLALLPYNSLLTEPPGFLHQHKSGLLLKSFTCFPLLLGQTTIALPWPRRPSTWDSDAASASPPRTIISLACCSPDQGRPRLGVFALVFPSAWNARHPVVCVDVSSASSRPPHSYFGFYFLHNIHHYINVLLLYIIIICIYHIAYHTEI